MLHFSLQTHGSPKCSSFFSLFLCVVLFSSSAIAFSALSLLPLCPSMDIFISVIVFFHSLIFILIFLFYFFAKTFYFSFVSSVLKVGLLVYLPWPVSFYTSVCFYVAVRHLSISTWTRFSLSRKAGLVVMSYFSFCLPGQVFISPSFPKDSSAR